MRGKYRIYLSDNNRIVVKAEKNFFYAIKTAKENKEDFLEIETHLININHIVAIEQIL